MTQEAALTLLTIERYLINNPDVSFAQALFHLHIIKVRGPSPGALAPSILMRDTDLQVMDRMIRSFPFRRKTIGNADVVPPTRQEIEDQVLAARDTLDSTLFPGLTFEHGVVSSLKWVNGLTVEKPMDL